MYDSATLEEAFGVRSFMAPAPEPPVMRGGVGPAASARDKAFRPECDEPLPLPHRPPAPPREPVQIQYTPWLTLWQAMTPEQRRQMMWQGVRESLHSEAVLLAALALFMFIVFKL